jgi:pyruvate dehydrogenase E1 component
VIAATIPNCRAYDPAFSYEVATIVDHGMRSMLAEGRDEFYYLTVMNENYAQPSMPAGVQDDIIKGLYRIVATKTASPQVRLVGSGAILPEILAAAKMLEDDWHIASEVWSATSFSELARDARDVERHNRLNPLSDQIECHASKCLSGGIPVVAASDYVRAYPQLIASYIEAPYTVLGTDGFGRSDTRAALRSFFEVDRKQIVLAALSAAACAGKIDRKRVADAIKRYEITVEVDSPWSR